MRTSVMQAAVSVIFAVSILTAPAAHAADHPSLLFSKDDIPAIKARAQHPILKPHADRLLARAKAMMAGPPILISMTKRGEPDAPGEFKGIRGARALQTRVLTYCMAFTLTGEKVYRDRAVAELDHALTNWKIWVDTAHAPPYDLMTGETCAAFGITYDWLYNDLTPEERQRIREGAEKRGLTAYLGGADRENPMRWLNGKNNWNVVCNGGATLLALALEGESKLSERSIELAVNGMAKYWDVMGDDGGWNEGTGYWTFGNRYGFLAAEALKRAGRRGGADIFARESVKRTCYFPIVFNPGKTLSASFGDVTWRAADPLFYLLGRELKNPDFIWYGDTISPPAIDHVDGWPFEPLVLLWRPVDEPWLPEAKPGFEPKMDPIQSFPSIGWAMMAPKQPNPPYFFAFKVGSLAASHTHLDLNNFIIARGETMLVAELGSRPYPADYFSGKRYQYYETGTAGQNSVLVGGKGQVPGKPGKLLGPFSSERFDGFIGVADGAYEVKDAKVRRHVVFVRKRYWVILDEVETPQPEGIEMRFHTYGAVKPSGTGWTFEEAGSVLEIHPAFPAKISGTVEQPADWIKPVHVLSIKGKTPATKWLLPTVLYVRASEGNPCGAVSCTETESEIKVTVGADLIVFEKNEKGWGIHEVAERAP